jgi:hypothetical protein
MSKLLTTICVTLFLAAVGLAQTASELADKYPHHEVYELQPGVQMTAKFATNGLVCEMRIEQTHFVEDGVDLRSGIDKERINGLIDQLVPPSERGEKDPGGNVIEGWGQGITEIDSYSNVTIDVSSSHGITVVTIKWRHRPCESLDARKGSPADGW